MTRKSKARKRETAREIVELPAVKQFIDNLVRHYNGLSRVMQRRMLRQGAVILRSGAGKEKKR